MHKTFSQQRRTEFPIFSAHPELVYLDSAATSQKPKAVIDTLKDFWSCANAPLHRGVYKLSAQITKRYEEARSRVAHFLGADAEELVFVRGATEGINLVASSFLAPQLEAGDNVVVSAMEHHANFVPWQQACQRAGAELRIIPLKTEELSLPNCSAQSVAVRLDLEAGKRLLDQRTKILAISQASNVLGQINPLAELLQSAKALGIPILVDGAQSIVHGCTDVRQLGCDFFVFSSHKIYGPDGIGALYGRKELLETMQPYQTGGDMVEFVSTKQTTFAPVPQCFEAGTMPVAAVIGLHTVLDYLDSLGWQQIKQHERSLLEQAAWALRKVPQLCLVGDEIELAHKLPILSFTIEGIHPHDIATILDSENIAVRAGHHCAQPLMQALGLAATTRASLGLYNSAQDIERLCSGLKKVIRIMT